MQEGPRKPACMFAQRPEWQDTLLGMVLDQTKLLQHYQFSIARNLCHRLVARPAEVTHMCYYGDKTAEFLREVWVDSLQQKRGFGVYPPLETKRLVQSSSKKVFYLGLSLRQPLDLAHTISASLWDKQRASRPHSPHLQTCQATKLTANMPLLPAPALVSLGSLLSALSRQIVVSYLRFPRYQPSLCRTTPREGLFRDTG